MNESLYDEKIAIKQAIEKLEKLKKNVKYENEDRTLFKETARYLKLIYKLVDCCDDLILKDDTDDVEEEINSK